MEKYVKISGIAIGVYLAIKFLLPLVYPFVLAALIVIPLHPCLEKIENKTKIGKSFLVVGLLLIGGCTVLLLLWFGISWVAGQVGNLLQQLDLFQNEVYSFVSDCCCFIENKTGFDATSMVTVMIEKADIFIDNFQINIVPKMMKRSMSYLKTAFGAVAFIAVTFISTVLLAKDYSKILNDLKKNQGFEKIMTTGSSIGSMIITFLKAQGIIMLCISGASSLLLFLSGVDGAFKIGILAGIMDVFPFIGTGIVLLPLAFWQLVQGNLLKAGLCILAYIVCALIREMLEPKLIGRKMGIYPIGILLAVYVGVKIYGIGGIILGPLSLLLIKELMAI